jgi:hypothetical protein
MRIKERVASVGIFLKNWGAVMSGALSVPFALLALFNVSGRLLFAILAYAALGVMAISKTRETSNLREQMRPKLRMFCDNEGCARNMTRTETPFVFFRVAVECVGVDQVSDCKGFLTRIEKDGAVRWAGDNVLLTFAPEGAGGCNFEDHPGENPGVLRRSSDCAARRFISWDKEENLAGLFRAVGVHVFRPRRIYSHD